MPAWIWYMLPKDLAGPVKPEPKGKNKKGHGGKIAKKEHGKKPSGPKKEAGAVIVGCCYDKYSSITSIDGHEYDKDHNVERAKLFEDLCRRSGVKEIVTLYDGGAQASGKPTKDELLKAIKKVGDKLGPEDMFIFYFCGLGTKE